MRPHPNCFLYQHCSPEWRLLIKQEARVYKVKKGASVFKVGDPAKGYYFIHEGWVKVHKKWKNNRDLILRFAGTGDVLGHRGMPDAYHPVTATALSSVTLCYISSELFKTTMLVNPNLAYQMTRLFAQELHEVEQNMRNLIQWDVKRRIANALCELANHFGLDAGGALKIQLSRQDIASYAGTTYESVFKTLNEWKHEQLIRLEGKKIHICQMNDFRAMVEADS